MILLLALLVIPATASAQSFSLDSAEVKLVLRDSKNAHMVAEAALGAVACILQSLSGTAEWTPEDCADKLSETIDEYAQEHRVLHPMIYALLKAKIEASQS